MGANIAHKGIRIFVKGNKVGFQYTSQITELRNEAWAKQQQSLAGYKIKKHGFNDFKEDRATTTVQFTWWCWKETADHLKDQLGDKLQSSEEVEEPVIA